MCALHSKSIIVPTVKSRLAPTRICSRDSQRPDIYKCARRKAPSVFQTLTCRHPVVCIGTRTLALILFWNVRWNPEAIPISRCISKLYYIWFKRWPNRELFAPESTLLFHVGCRTIIIQYHTRCLVLVTVSQRFEDLEWFQIRFPYQPHLQCSDRLPQAFLPED